MIKEQLADLLIKRLNDIAIVDEQAMYDLINTRVKCSEALANHPSVQVNKIPEVGFLGMLNGLVGVIDEGSKIGYGLITASITETDNRVTVRFLRTSED